MVRFSYPVRSASRWLTSLLWLVRLQGCLAQLISFTTSMPSSEWPCKWRVRIGFLLSVKKRCVCWGGASSLQRSFSLSGGKGAKPNSSVTFYGIRLDSTRSSPKKPLLGTLATLLPVLAMKKKRSRVLKKNKSIAPPDCCEFNAL